MPKIIGFGGEEKNFDAGELIRDKCEEMGVPFGCKDGECGCCRILVEDGVGNLSPKNAFYSKRGYLKFGDRRNKINHN